MSEDQISLTGRKLILMVDELHKLGYELIRLNPSMSPSGLYWRCDIKPFGEKRLRMYMDEISKSHEADYNIATYSSAQGANIFKWSDTTHNSSLELAHKFIKRFPILIKHGKGIDKEYTEWYWKMIEDTKPMGLIYGFADYALEEGEMGLLNCKENLVIAKPPTGENA